MTDWGPSEWDNVIATYETLIFWQIVNVLRVDVFAFIKIYFSFECWFSTDHDSILTEREHRGYAFPRQNTKIALRATQMTVSSLMLHLERCVVWVIHSYGMEKPFYESIFTELNSMRLTAGTAVEWLHLQVLFYRKWNMSSWRQF